MAYRHNVMRRVGRALPSALLTLLITLSVITAAAWNSWAHIDRDHRPGAATTTTTGGRGPDRIRHVVAFGDSVPTGKNCDCVPFPWLVADALQASSDHPVQLDNFGIDGSSAVDLVESLNDDDEQQQAVSQADLILLTTGANDLLPAQEDRLLADSEPHAEKTLVDDTGGVLRLVLARIRHLNPNAQVLVTTYWNVFRDGRAEPDERELAWNDAITRSFNAVLTSAAQDNGAQVVDLYRPFKGDGSADPTRLLAEDGDHPNAAGHHLIADTIVRVVTGG